MSSYSNNRYPTRKLNLDFLSERPLTEDEIKIISAGEKNLFEIKQLIASPESTSNSMKEE